MNYRSLTVGTDDGLDVGLLVVAFEGCLLGENEGEVEGSLLGENEGEVEGSLLGEVELPCEFMH